MPPRCIVAKPSPASALTGLLLAVACGVAGCRDDRPAAPDGVAAAPAPVAATPSATAPSLAPATPPDDTAAPVPPAADTGARIPEALRGVWYPDTDQGRADCKAYRVLTPEQHKREPGGAPLVGATFVFGRLVHQFSEYGEGNYYAVRDVQPIADGEWRMKSLLWPDSRPAPNAPADEFSQPSIDGLALRNERLYWYRDVLPTAISLAGKPDDPALFRCAAVRPEIYPVEPGLD